ncbi:TSUP family transporter, partial [Bacillus cereus]|uniref:TSUP family transporter n=1 Tax=Bacillus cereus TaxID=1396 RepID=UPI003601C265
VLMLGIDMQIAIGTSLLIIVANSAAGLISHLGSGVTIDPAITISFTGAAIVASVVAGRCGNRVDTGKLQHWFAYLVFAVAAYILFDTLVLSR